MFSPSRNHIRRSLGGDSGAGAVVLCTQVHAALPPSPSPSPSNVDIDVWVQLKGSPLPQVLKEDGAMTMPAHSDGDWISAEDVRRRTLACVCVCARAAVAHTCPRPPTVGDVAARRRGGGVEETLRAAG